MQQTVQPLLPLLPLLGPEPPLRVCDLLPCCIHDSSAPVLTCIVHWSAVHPLLPFRQPLSSPCPLGANKRLSALVFRKLPTSDSSYQKHFTQIETLFSKDTTRMPSFRSAMIADHLPRCSVSHCEVIHKAQFFAYKRPLCSPLRGNDVLPLNETFRLCIH